MAAANGKWTILVKNKEGREEALQGWALSSKEEAEKKAIGYLAEHLDVKCVTIADYSGSAGSALHFYICQKPHAVVDIKDVEGDLLARVAIDRSRGLPVVDHGDEGRTEHHKTVQMTAKGRATHLEDALWVDDPLHLLWTGQDTKTPVSSDDIVTQLKKQLEEQGYSGLQVECVAEVDAPDGATAGMLAPPGIYWRSQPRCR
jgi:hypothetical protein